MRLIFRIIFLTDRQVSKLCKSFANNSSANIKNSKTQLSNIEKLRGTLGKLLGSLLKTGWGKSLF